MRNIFRTISKLAAGSLVIASIGGLLIFSGCKKSETQQAASDKYGSTTLKLYLPGEYKSDEFIPNFEKQFGVKVIVETFDSNEMMYAKVEAGDKYDVLIPSDYMIERLLKQKALQPLDKYMIPNLDLLADEVKNLSYDPDNTYSVPYFWGNVGIVYNRKHVDKADLEKDGYGIYHNEKYAGKVYWYDSQRDSFMVALKNLGYSMNTDKESEINEAYNWLVKMNDVMKPHYVTDEVIDNMRNGLMDIAIVYSGDAAYILSENADMDFYAPTEGTNLWYDAMVIPANAENPKLANEFINYALTYEAAYGNAEAVGYASANAKVLKDMKSSGGIYEKNAAYLPRTNYPKDEIFHDNDVIRQLISKLWIKVKAR